MSAIRRISEDARFRPFLTSHFDAEGYIRSVIKDGKSEEVFADLETCIAEVNEEIKGYISVHKHDLMSGMQDVAVLAARYQTLQSLSSRVRACVDRLKKETLDTHSLVQRRTTELERIHTTGIILRQLRQFAHALAQLEHYVNGGAGEVKDNKDIRQYTSAAKTLHELEQLIKVPQLQAVHMVVQHAPSIRTFGEQLREASKERLLVALRDRNQAVVADCLQIFFNLQSLPEIVVLAVDNAVRATSDISSASIDLEIMVSIAPDLSIAGLASEKGAVTPMRGSVAAAAPPSSGKKGPMDPSALARQASQLRVAMRELSHLWSTKLFEQALQIHVLQRVIAKKEDPSTHVRFIEVLRSSDALGQASDLSSGNLLELFYTRLVVSLQDVISEKIKHYPIAAARVYPSLRKAAADVAAELKTMASKHSGSVEDVMLSIFSGADGATGSDVGAQRANSCFGSLSWTLQDSTLGQLPATCRLPGGNWSESAPQKIRLAGMSGPAYSCVHFPGADDVHEGGALGALLEDWPGLASAGSAAAPEDRQGLHGDTSGAVLTHAMQERGLLEGLRPMRDRYLIGVFARITAPIHQMFPEMEGYTSAVPSKRDLLSFVKAVQVELVDAANESDTGLIRFVCKEISKAVHLLITKIEGMVQASPDSSKMDSGRKFARTSAQDHNYQLMVLITQLRDAVEKLPSQVVKLLDENAVSAEEDARLNAIRSAVSSYNAVSIERIDSLAGRVLMAPLVDSIVEYFKGVFLGLYKEGSTITHTSSSAGLSSSSDMNNSDCSKAVQLVLKQFPEAVAVHLTSLPKHPSVVWAVEEAGRRLLVLYVTVIVLLRPVTEMSRLRAAADMTALELMISGLQSQTTTRMTSHSTKGENVAPDPVHAEFKALRRLLFEDKVILSGSSRGGNGLKASNAAPVADTVLGLPYIGSMRPSTLLGYLISCGPTQLPPPFEATNSNRKEKDVVAALGEYVDALTRAPLGGAVGSMSEAAVESVSGTGGYLMNFSVSNIYRFGPEWRKSVAETNSWNSMQKSLEVLIQRSAVVAEADRLLLRQWYESLCAIGATLHSSGTGVSVQRI